MNTFSSRLTSSLGRATPSEFDAASYAASDDDDAYDLHKPKDALLSRGGGGRRRRRGGAAVVFFGVEPSMRCLGRMLCVALTIATIASPLILLPILAVHAADKGSIDWFTYYLAGLFVLVTVPLSMHSIVLHLTNWYVPQVQKYVVRILFMVPIYSVQSFLSLVVESATFYIEVFRDLYEAFVISSFVYYLVELLGGEAVLAATLRRKHARYGQHPACLPRTCFRPWTMGEDFVLSCKHGVLQFVVIKAVTAIITVVLKATGHYEKGVWSWTNGYGYIAIMLNVSMSWAMYCLVKFFYATKDELRSPKNWHPVGKFLCIKGVVFFTFWQGFVLSLLQSFGVIREVGHWDADHVATGLQDMLVCAEMLGFAIAHRYTFTHTEYLWGRSSEEEAALYVDSASAAGHGGKGGDFGGGGSADDVARGSLAVPEGARGGDGNDDDDYRPPTIRQLHAPLSVSSAILGSAVPGETLSDIARLSRGAAYASARERGSGPGGRGRGKGGSEDVAWDPDVAESI